MKNYKITKKLLSLLLAVLMVFSTVSVVANGAEEQGATCSDGVHIYGATIEKVVATCVADGYEKNVCRDCLETYEVIIPASGHKLGKETIVAAAEHTPSRIREGTVRRDCLNCEYFEINEYSIGHDFTDSRVVETKPATCVETGKVSIQCKLCLKGISHISPVDKTAHRFDEQVYIIGSPINSDNDFRGIKVCADCGAIEYTTVEHDEYHKYIDWKVETPLAEDAVCDKQTGVYVRKCDYCKKEVEKQYFSKAHQFVGGTAGVAADCTNLGYEEGTCGVCEEEVRNVLFTDESKHNWLPTVFYSREISIDGKKCVNVYLKRCANNPAHIVFETVENVHVFEGDWTEVKATCKEDGYRVNTCLDCKSEIKETTELKVNVDHSYDETKKIDIIYSTCETEGSESVWCTVCEEYITRTIPKHLSNSILAEVDEATCIAEGKAKYVCRACSHPQVKILPVDPEGHNPGDADIVVEEPTCCVDGIKAKECRRCGGADRSTDAPIKKTNKHVVNGWVETKPATCTDGGYKERKCTGVCDGKECAFTEIVDLAASHNYSSWDTALTPDKISCKESVTRTRFCLTCKDEVQKETFRGAHTPGVYDGFNCEVGGVAKIKCAECNEIYATEILAPGAHILDNGVDIELDDKDDLYCGGKRYNCLVCAAVVEKPIEHTYYTIYEGVPGNCTTMAIPAQFACKVCGVHVVEEVEVPTGHNFTWVDANGTVRCTKCGAYEDDDAGVVCSHFCHSKKMTTKLIVKVFAAFWKLFKLNHFCTGCLTPHYHAEETTIISTEVNKRGKLVVTYSCTKCKVEEKEVVLR